MDRSTKDEPTVFIVDDDPSVRKSLRLLISAAGGYRVECYENAYDLLLAVSTSASGCAVIDVRMPGVKGPELHELLRERSPALAVVFLTGFGDVQTSVSVMKRGAIDYLLKPVSDEVLLETVERAFKHSAEMRRQLGRLKNAQLAADQLSPREREVLEYVIGGYLNKQIAAELAIAEKTVKVHRARVMAKMRARSVAELVRVCEIARVQPRERGSVDYSVVP